MLRAAALLLLLLVPGAGAATVVLDLAAMELDGAPLYRDPSGGDPSPMLRAPQGAHVEIRLANRGETSHGLLLGGPVSKGLPCCLAPGEDGTLAFDLPSSFTGNVTILCPLHGDAGMRALLRVGPAPPTVRITHPANGTTVRGVLAAVLAVENVTGPWHVRLALDGKEVANVTTHGARLEPPAEGHHLLAADLLDANGTRLARHESVFYFDPRPVEAAPSPEEPPTPTATPGPTPAPTPLAPWLLVAALVLAAALRRSR